MDVHLETIRQRRDWLTARIAAKLTVGWDVEWDIRERDAHKWALEQLEQIGKNNGENNNA